MIYAVINTYVILDSCISSSRKWLCEAVREGRCSRRLSLSTSCVPRPRDNLSTGDAHN